MNASRKPLVGLALGSGSARGWAHVGVIRALEVAGIRPCTGRASAAFDVPGGGFKPHHHAGADHAQPHGGEPPDVIVAPRLGHFDLLDFHRAGVAASGL